MALLIATMFSLGAAIYLVCAARSTATAGSSDASTTPLSRRIIVDGVNFLAIWVAAAYVATVGWYFIGVTTSMSPAILALNPVPAFAEAVVYLSMTYCIPLIITGVKSLRRRTLWSHFTLSAWICFASLASILIFGWYQGSERRSKTELDGRAEAAYKAVQLPRGSTPFPRTV